MSTREALIRIYLIFLGSLSSNRAGEAAGDPTFGNLFNLFRPAIRIPSQIMTRIPRFRFKDRPKPNPIRIQNVFVDPPIVPINVAQPGEPGGGGIPASNPAIADNLVPRGLRPVAVFPPYLFPRTVPAQCLIFLEPDPPKKRPVYGKNIVICSPHFFPNSEFLILNFFVRLFRRKIHSIF